MKEEIKKLKWIIESAVGSEENHYKDIESGEPGWMQNAREIL